MVESPPYALWRDYLRPAVLPAITILVPTAGLLWLTLRTVEQERKIGQRERDDLCQTVAEDLARKTASQWTEALGDLSWNPDGTTDTIPNYFGTGFPGGHEDAAVLLDDEGKLLQPARYERGDLDRYIARAAGNVAKPPPPPAAPDAVIPFDLRDTRWEKNESWRAAERLEFTEENFDGAANAYVSIGDGTANLLEACQATLAAARCLEKAGDVEDAYRLLAGPAEGQFRNGWDDVIDQEFRRMRPMIINRAIELYSQWNDTETLDTTVLLPMLTRACDPPMPTAQRVFLLEQIGLRGHLDPVETGRLDAVRLAWDYVERYWADKDGAALGTGAVSLVPVPDLDLWHGRNLAPYGKIVLYRRESIRERCEAAIGDSSLMDSLQLAARFAFEDETVHKAFGRQWTFPVGEPLPGWQVVIDQKPAAATDDLTSRALLYLWSGILLTALFVLCAGVVARLYFRQLRVTRLKNDLIATVSHELRTPLASMRVLVDTLIEERLPDPGAQKEYLALIARENLRLSRMVENFLAFSRMERNAFPVHMESVAVQRIVDEARASVAERFGLAGRPIEIEIAPSLPQVRCDPEAMVTALVNLLDNAHKFSPDGTTPVVLRATAHGGQVQLSVADAGMGLSRRAAAKVFRRYYQADQRLARAAGGCGLGLSIVDHIMKAHGGRVTVESKLGEGSVFTLHIPTIPEA